MHRYLRAYLPFLVSFVAAATGGAAAAQTFPDPSLRDTTVADGRPGLTIDSPTDEATVQGVVIIRFRAENVRIVSLFHPNGASGSPLPTAHLHVTVDDAPWHWVHSTSDPVVITPLSPGAHTVTLELAGADHRPLVVRTVRFTIAANGVSPTDHAGHP